MRSTGSWFLAFLLIFLSTSLSAEDDTGRVGPKQPSSTSAGVNHPQHLEAPIVLLVSFDGFRADYLDRYDLPNFQRFMREGVRAQGLIPVFPSVTSPNHYSIVTGLYPERHGIVGNVFYDLSLEEVFSFSSSANGSWYRGDPIWRVAESQGMVTACHSWPAVLLPSRRRDQPSGNHIPELCRITGDRSSLIMVTVATDAKTTLSNIVHGRSR